MPRRSKIFRYDAKLDEVVEVRQRSVEKKKAKWPIYSEAAGVAPSQVGEARQKFKQMGLDTEVTNRGEVVFRSPRHRKQHCEHPMIQFYDRNGGYSDPQRR